MVERKEVRRQRRLAAVEVVDGDGRKNTDY